MEVIKKHKKELIFHLGLNIIIGIFISFSSYYNLPLFYLKDYVTYGIHFLILQFTIFGFTYFLSLNKEIFYFLFPILFFTSANTAFWMYTQDISISDSLIQAVFETKLDIVFDLLSYQLILVQVVLLLIIYVVINSRKKISQIRIKSPFSVLAIIAISLFFYMYSYGMGNLQWRMPYSLSFGVVEYIKKPKMEFISVGNQLNTNRQDLNIVFVLGESVRGKNMQLNGYHRQTNPLLKNKKNVVSYPNIYTPFTYTAASVPQIVSNKSISDTVLNNKYVSLYAVLNKINFFTKWIGNQTPEKSYLPFIEQNDSIHLIDFQHGVFSFNKKRDEGLLPFFKESMKIKRNNFITIHMIGSHWWYENRYTDEFRKFEPTVNSKYIPSQSKTQMINSYDNTILYLDYFLNQVIDICAKRKDNTLVIYLSDHGEILGEDGLYLHAQKSKANTNPAMLVWYSDGLKKRYPTIVENLENNRNNQISTDFFYHSILDLLEVTNIEIDKSKSIFDLNCVNENYIQ